MKVNIKNIGLSAMALLALVSCSDVVDYKIPDRTSNHGAPVISNIYDVQDTGFVAPLSVGVLNQMLHIKGENLANVKRVRFNDVEVDVRQVYATTTDAWVKIPRVVPTTQDDELVYETNVDSVKMTFPISIPSVKIDGLKMSLPSKAIKYRLIQNIWISMASVIPLRLVLHQYILRILKHLTEKSCIATLVPSSSPAS